MLNGLALYTAWTILASLVNLIQAWNYVDPVCPEGNICPINHARKRMEVSSLTALSFLREHCRWSIADCRAAANKQNP